jgi:hypothetical protein
MVYSTLLNNLGDNASADGTTTFADREAETFVHRDWRDQLDFQVC